VKENLIPRTHAGLLAGYDVNKALSIGVLVANPANSGLLNNAGSTGNKYDLGAQIGYNDMVRLTAGMLMRKVGTETATMLDFIAGTNVGALALDGELTMGKMVTGTTVAANSTMGVAVQGVYGMSETLGAGVRFEMLNKLGGAPEAKQMAITAGPQYSFTKELKVKWDHTFMTSRTVAAGDATKTHENIIAAVYKF
jgi:hypothetical protein